MDKIYGATQSQDGLYKIGRSKWELIYGYGKDSEDAEVGYNFRQRFTYLPDKEEIRRILTEQINANTNETILNGLVWQGTPVYLSMESQANIMRIALLGTAYPLNLKLGESADGVPQYYNFSSADEFSEFAHAVSEHITNAVQSGYAEKDKLDDVISCFSI